MACKRSGVQFPPAPQFKTPCPGGGSCCLPGRSGEWRSRPLVAILVPIVFCGREVPYTRGLSASHRITAEPDQSAQVLQELSLVTGTGSPERWRRWSAEPEVHPSDPLPFTVKKVANPVHHRPKLPGLETPDSGAKNKGTPWSGFGFGARFRGGVPENGGAGGGGEK